VLENVGCLILAAGQGKRMKSDTPKVLQKLLNRPLAGWVLESTMGCLTQKPVMVVGHGRQQVMEAFHDRCEFVVQEEQLGTGHAVMQAREYIKNLKQGYVVVLSGDTPLITSRTIEELCSFCRKGSFVASVLSAELENPFGYGRIVRDENGEVEAIVEEKDATQQQKQIKEINSGIYCFFAPALLDALDHLTNQNSQGEYYLTDTIACLKNKGLAVGSIPVSDAEEITGINDKEQLYWAQKAAARKIAVAHMKKGVTIYDIESTFISPDAIIGADTEILPGVIIREGCQIGEGCTIGPNTLLEQAQIGDRTRINASQCYQCTVGSDTTIGPFSHLRPATHIGDHIRIGNFVELKNAQIDHGTKVSHLTYVGDSVVGKNVNFGCGVITVNYDGDGKYITTICDDVFVGCNSNLVAPITIQSHSYIAAGSTITDEVGQGQLAIARAKQVNKEGWVKKREEKGK
jgi:bifunctional UDP-N-acetylglucosamine pyrophosphorylase/glucosamine-1-phosphate N-acetyltransferase